MSQSAIYADYLRSPMNAKARAEAVNAMRHLAMDVVRFDVTDDDAYMSVYRRIMECIASDFPSLSWEVKRQMAKKRRRQVRRSLVKQEAGMHIRP